MTTTALPVFTRRLGARVSRPQPLTPTQTGLAAAYLERFRVAALRGPVVFSRSALDLTGEDDDIRAAYQEMLADPFVKGAIFGKLLSVASQDLNLVPADPEDEASVGQAEYLKWMLNHVEGGFATLAWTILVGACLDGKALAEKVWGPVEKGKWRGKVKLAKVKDKHPKTYRLVCDEFLNVTHIESANGVNRWRRLPLDGFILYQHAKIYQNPHGMGDLRAAYAGWVKRSHIGKLRMIFLDKFSGPFLSAKYEREDQRASLEEALKQARSEGYITLSPNAELEILNLMPNGTGDFGEAEKDAQQEIFMGICGAYLQALEGTTPSGRGNSETHRGVAELFQWHLSQALAAVINEQILPEATETNFGPDVEPPTAVLGAIDVGYLQQELSIDSGLSKLGVPLSAKEVYGRYNRSPPKDDADKLVAPAPGGFGLPFADSSAPHSSNSQPPAPDAPPAGPFRRLGRGAKWAAYAAGRNGR
jgi:hypothetical protein